MAPYWHSRSQAKTPAEACGVIAARVAALVQRFTPPAHDDDGYRYVKDENGDEAKDESGDYIVVPLKEEKYADDVAEVEEYALSMGVPFSRDVLAALLLSVHNDPHAWMPSSYGC